jgi:hypothetical protein
MLRKCSALTARPTLALLLLLLLRASALLVHVRALLVRKD